MDKAIHAIKPCEIIAHMNESDHLSLDGHALRLLVTVAETGSITAAAARLELTQSAVSHALNRLRLITGDALFVRSGRGIVATPQAGVLVQRAQALLEDLRAFSELSAFEPTRWSGLFTVAANDLQRDLLLPPLLRRLREQAGALSLRVIPSGAPRADLLRGEGCDLLLTPRPPQGSDIVHKRLFDDRYVVFFDAEARAAPTSRAAWLAAEHATVRYVDGRGLDLDDLLAARGIHRRIVATVPGFCGLAALLRGGPWLATVPARLGQGVLRGLAQTALPLSVPDMPMYAVWHARRQDDPMHRWVRQALDGVVAALG
jgi:DNA-binding transcriptional LysR family regulator